MSFNSCILQYNLPHYIFSQEMAASVAIGVVACQQVEVCLDQSEGEHCGHVTGLLQSELTCLYSVDMST